MKWNRFLSDMKRIKRNTAFILWIMEEVASGAVFVVTVWSMSSAWILKISGCCLKTQSLNVSLDLFLFQDFMCLHCLFSDPVTNFSLCNSYYSSFDHSANPSFVRLSLNGGSCYVCGKKDGYMTMTFNRTFVHKQCARSVPGVIYNEFLSYIKPATNMQYQKIPRPCFEDNCEDQIEVPLSPHVRSHIEYIIPPLHPQFGLSCSVCHMRRGRVVRCGYTGCTRQFHLSCIRPYICVCFPTPTGLFIRCSEHLPQDYRYDQKLNAIVPVGSATLQTSLSDLVSSLRRYRSEWEKLHGRMAAQVKESRQLLELKKNEVVRYHKRKMHFCSILSSYVLQVEKSMMEPWILTQQGLKATDDLMVFLSDRLDDFVPSSAVLGARKVGSGAHEKKSNSSGVEKSKHVYREKKQSKHNANSRDFDESSARNSDDEFVLESSSNARMTKRTSSRFKHKSNRQVQNPKKEGEMEEELAEEPVRVKSKGEETVKEVEIKEIMEETIEKVVGRIVKETEENTEEKVIKKVADKADKLTEKAAEKAVKEKQEPQRKRTKEKEKLVIQNDRKEETKVEKQEKLTEKEGKKQEKKERQKNSVKQTKPLKQSKQSKRVTEAKRTKETKEMKEIEKKEKQRRKMSYQAKRLRAQQLVDEWMSNELLQKQLAAERRRKVEERRQQTLMKREEAKQRELEEALLHYVAKTHSSAEDSTDKAIQEEAEGTPNETPATGKTSADSPKKSLRKPKEETSKTPKSSSNDTPKENKSETPKKTPKKSAKEIPKKVLNSANSIDDSKITHNTPNKPKDLPHDVSTYYLKVLNSLPAGMKSWLLQTDDDHKGHPLSQSEQLIYTEKTKYESIADRSMTELSTVFYPHTAKLSSKSLAIVRIVSRSCCLDAFL